jgi:signal transduction histidine kinase
MSMADRLRAWPWYVTGPLTAAAAVAAHGLGSWFVVSFRGEPLYVIWPGVGIGLAALYILGLRFWPWVLGGSILAQVLGPSDLQGGYFLLLYPAVDTSEAVAGAVLLRRFDIDVTFPRVRDVGRYLLLVCLVVTACGTALGASVAVALGDQYYRAPITWVHWWLADVQSMAHVAPALLTWALPPSTGVRHRASWSFALLLAGVVGTAVIVGWTAPVNPFAPTLYILPVALVLVAAVRYGPRGATLASVVATATVLVVAFPSGTVSDGPAINRFAGIEVASIVMVALALTLGALVSELTLASREREHMAAQLMEAQRLEGLGRIAAGVAHDFNNLLTAILGNAALLRMQTTDPRARQLLQEVEDTSQRAAELCRQMLTVGGKSRAKPEPLDVTVLVEDTARVLRSATGRAVPIVFDLARALPPVVADATQMRQVLMNLVINAREACEGREGARIVIRTAALTWPAEGVPAPTPLLSAGRYVKLTVQDNGVGMDAETRTRVFDPFFSTKFVGRGLGLAVVHGIVRAAQGGVAVDSTPGVGSTFRMLLPAAADMTWGGVSDDRGRGRVVVVGDPDAMTRAILMRMLSENGWVPVAASDVSSTLAACRDRTAIPAVVVLDEHLSSLPALVSRIDHERPGVSIVVASRTPLDVRDPPASGRRPPVFLEKPFGPHALAAALTTATS